MAIGMKKTTHLTFDQALERIPEALKGEGFGILTQIDVKATMKEKLGIDFRRYRILGACNPKLAYRALSAELEVGVMMPCNVIVYETDDRGTMVSAVDPMQTLAAQGDAAVRPLAAEVQQKLQRVIDSL